MHIQWEASYKSVFTGGLEGMTVIFTRNNSGSNTANEVGWKSQSEDARGRFIASWGSALTPSDCKYFASERATRFWSCLAQFIKPEEVNKKRRGCSCAQFSFARVRNSVLTTGTHFSWHRSPTCRWWEEREFEKVVNLKQIIISRFLLLFQEIDESGESRRNSAHKEDAGEGWRRGRTATLQKGEHWLFQLGNVSVYCLSFWIAVDSFFLPSWSNKIPRLAWWKLKNGKTFLWTRPFSFRLSSPFFLLED